MTGEAARGAVMVGVAIALAAGVLLTTPAAAAQPPPNDAIANATPIPVPPYWDTVDMTTATAAPDDPSCGAGGLSVWHVYTADRDGEVTFELIGSDGTTAVSVYRGAPGALERLGCAEGRYPVTVPVSGGMTYYILSTVDPDGYVGWLHLNVSVVAEIEVTVDSVGTAGRDGHATVSGTITCTWPLVESFVSGTVRQVALGRLLVGAEFRAAVGFCDGVVPWTATTSEEHNPATGFLRVGRAVVSAYALGCDELPNCYEDRVDTQVRLRFTRGPAAQTPTIRRIGSMPK